jgi:glycosyltransferase involved in cell wall biosynthesis
MHQIVMLLSNSFRPDSRVLKEAEYLQKNGFDITVLCWDRQAELSESETLSSGVRIIRIQNIRSTYGIGIRQLLKIPRFWISVQHYLGKLKPRLVHCHDFDTLLAGLWYGMLHHIPVVYDAHEYYSELVNPRLHGIIGKLLYRLINWSEHIGARNARAVVTVDEALAAIYRRNNHNMIILGNYPEKSKAEKNNPVFSRPNLTLLYAGRLSVDRGLLLYADMLSMLLQKEIPVRLLLAGVFTPESEHERFNVYAHSIINSVEFIGWIPYEQMSSVYREADIGLAILLPEPRYVAATPVKLFEYMANGLPVVASDFPSIEGIIKESDCGILVDPLADLSPTVNTIALWWQNKAVPRRLGENGRQAVLLKYHWENQASRLVQLYQELS